MKLRVPAGALLASSPDLLDPNFVHTVVLMCRHTDEGAIGVAINRFSGYDTTQVLPEHPVLGQLEFPIGQGGPVGLDTLQVLHRIPQQVPDGIPLGDDLWWGGDIEQVASFLNEEKIEGLSRVRLLVGYAGWGPGQLDLELATGSWLPAPGTSEIVFEDDPRTLWRNVVRAVSGDGASNEYNDPRLN